MQACAVRLGAIALAVAAIFGSPFAGPADGHVLRGTETWVHIAEPGVEVSFTVSDPETARALDLSEESDNSAARTWTSAWRVEADGKPCPVEAGSPALTRKGGHLRFALRYRCGVIREKLELTPVFLSEAPPGGVHVARVLIGDRMAPFDLTAKAQPIVLKVGELLTSWNIALSPNYLGSRD